MLEYFLIIASGLTASTYGYNELNCGDEEKNQNCATGAVTASGEPFEPYKVASAAIAIPTPMRLRSMWIWLRLADSTALDRYACKRIRLNDKMHQRYINKRGFDLSPNAQRLLTGKKAVSHWSDRVVVCGYEDSSGNFKTIQDSIDATHSGMPVLPPN